ncbi:MAG: acylneuraminate cytidylyltransferase family protein [Proteobacteria bacterium]|nr:acylneuraminate cytidylyltransferase family protein [Pseudomonadota bacterium]MBU1687948.1 acylneuraminate cytidylyltransferase family protein [Pseudomonadota bacterium]
MSKLRPVCIIPARGGSKRLPRKNIALLAGKPLLAYAIEAARDSGLFDWIVVSSEDSEILKVASQYGAAIDRRAPELATDTAQVKTVCRELLLNLAQRGEHYQEFAVLLVTNPLRTAEDLKEAYQVFQDGDADTLMSLVPFSHPPQRAVRLSGGRVTPFLDGEQMKQTQLLEPLYRHDGSFIFGRVEPFLAGGEFYGGRVAPFVLPPEHSVDIDQPIDLLWAEFLIAHIARNQAAQGSGRMI